MDRQRELTRYLHESAPAQRQRRLTDMLERVRRNHRPSGWQR